MESLIDKRQVLTEFPKGIRFKYSWRKYQQRVFDRLDHYLRDGHLHVIAPPGSGKTILGLEVALRLNRPVLILAPTVAIRQQWIQRFSELFLQTDQIPDWISTDIRKPCLMTVVTYQALHAACNNLRINESEIDIESETELEIAVHPETELESDEIDAKTKAIKGTRKAKRFLEDSDDKNLAQIVKGLIAQNINTVIVDEAHHLKNEWWKTLTKVKDQLNPVIVGLTATPPYDVSVNEWQRYLELNGPVDIEISVPELVIENDLCPHQDYIHFTLPTAEDEQRIKSFRQSVSDLYLEIKADETLITALKTWTVWINPTAHLEWIYGNFSVYAACLIFLKASGAEIPDQHLEVAGGSKFEIPILDYTRMENILQFYLFNGEYFKEFDEHREKLRNRLTHYGIVNGKQINLWHNKKVTGFLTSSTNKLNSIKEIADFEYQQLGAALRMVILSDYIRKEFYVNSAEHAMVLNKMGVMPIFEKLRRDNPAQMKIGVLTGSIVILPKSAYACFEVLSKAEGFLQVSVSALPFDADYLLIQADGKLRNSIIKLVTAVFQSGGIEVLIGTKSLLGEGWDAPAINSLILASFVGSFVLSNQMRGRAIRTQKDNPGKTGNIWHLVCIDPTSATGGEDFEMLKRRFKGFAGVSFKKEAGIENGIGRLNIPQRIHSAGEIATRNQETLYYAGDRASLKENWNSALKAGVELVEEIKIPFSEKKPYQKQKKMYLNKTLAYLLAELFFGLMSFGMDMIRLFFRSLRQMKNLDSFFNWLILAGVLGFIYFGRQLYKALRLYLKYRDISKDMFQISNAILKSLIKAKAIQSDPSQLEIIAVHDNYGAVYCHLKGGTTFENSVFINALKEVVDIMDNPRYIMVRKSWLFSVFRQKDYHAVPEILARNKNLAEYLKVQWKALVGPCNLIFTRTLEGRKLLLKSRMQSLSSEFEQKSEQVNKWK
ncbi:superfamily II DNA or RNA helicase [Pedobacter cryoconitis]|uniref:Superfamily II DNA or RNA helicase n=1 Tax=Pedobacter cryoconitis TaxID=188932 RepID=A0A7W8ZNB8_9SPHI|nr:DEAD/DEAH box helicase family protein [Pedobacter cryoconitis]MBB5637203.1 superfamily II DNA or RNA helicase [Pedobacter cryoconitis]